MLNKRMSSIATIMESIEPGQIKSYINKVSSKDFSKFDDAVKEGKESFRTVM